jgi:hypothetical protein
VVVVVVVGGAVVVVGGAVVVVGVSSVDGGTVVVVVPVPWFWFWSVPWFWSWSLSFALVKVFSTWTSLFTEMSGETFTACELVFVFALLPLPDTEAMLEPPSATAAPPGKGHARGVAADDTGVG